MIPVVYVIANFISQISSPFYAKVAGMRNMLLILTAIQACLTIAMIFTKSIDILIIISALLGLTGGRQAFSYLYLTDIVPMTHISFISMWFSGSIAIAIIVQCTYFYFWPHWKYFLIFNIVWGFFITALGSCILVESPMQMLLRGKVQAAQRTLDYIKKFNGMNTGREIILYNLKSKIEQN